ncbi:hypothetical protein DTW90_08690 [Neorhizobium sp. P12A]|uniref:hypothetical protein n=1 Tax=Neorhizobium sp. P12A TaxID=2268027 RepID=UPI0011EE1DB4|nr:hypothetical protein [Neorhizobium sp. P12A]KAA0699452.1 hypothetical protein DTW90_08690 [Neorhizobium sp. P12A]
MALCHGNVRYPPEAVNLSYAERIGIKPNILMTRSNKKSPTGRKAKISNDGGALVFQMRNMHRLEEFGVGGKFISTPNEPTAGAGLRRMSQAI